MAKPEEMTVDETQTLAILQAKLLRVQTAAAQEQQRVRVATLLPIATALGGITQVKAAITALNDARGKADMNMDTVMRIDRIITILTNDALPLVAEASEGGN